MLRAAVLAVLTALSTLVVSIPRASSGQAVGVLHIKVALVDAGGHATPVPRHALLISDNPATASPRRVVTTLDGTAEVRLRPGNYTVESDQPVAYQGKAYEWRAVVDIAAGRDAVLELTAGNAEVGPASEGMATTAVAPEADPSALLVQWQDSVVALWTPTAHASGFVVDAEGLLATSQRVIGPATAVEVQLTPAVKVAGSVLVADKVRDVAVVRIDPKVLASVRPVPLGCGSTQAGPPVAGQRIVALSSPLRDEKDAVPGAVGRVTPHEIESDIRLAPGSAGGPVFAAGGPIGLTSIPGDDAGDDPGRRRDAPIVPLSDVCPVVAAAVTKTRDVAPPDGAHLPAEPARPFPAGARKEASAGRAGSLSPYRMSSSDFDVAFITPVLAYGAQAQASGRDRGGGTPDAEEEILRGLTDFGNWSGYLADFPPVLLIRVTPKFVESFWTTVARGAARTQGVSLPPIKRFKPGFSRMRAFCGDAEVTPIHPFVIERRVSESDAILEGLYVFDPGALGPPCGSVKLVLFSEKDPAQADSRMVDPRIVQQIWQDFAPYRGAR